MDKTMKIITDALQNTTNPNNEERKKSEDLIRNAKKVPGYTTALL